MEKDLRLEKQGYYRLDSVLTSFETNIESRVQNIEDRLIEGGERKITFKDGFDYYDDNRVRTCVGVEIEENTIYALTEDGLKLALSDTTLGTSVDFYHKLLVRLTDTAEMQETA